MHIHIPGRKDALKLHGSASPYAIAGHGITAGVPVDVWEAAKTLHADAKWLANGFVFANGDRRTRPTRPPNVKMKKPASRRSTRSP